MANVGGEQAFVPTVSTRAIIAILRYGPRDGDRLPAHAIYVQNNVVPITWYKANEVWLSKRRFRLNHTFAEFLAACMSEPRIVTWTTEENVVWCRAA